MNGPHWTSLTRPRGRRRRSGRRGVALLVVLGAIIVMTVLITEMNWGASVRFKLAAHQRDEAQAYWLARSGVNLYRLILMGNYQLKNSAMFSSFSEMLGSTFGVNLGDALWQAVPSLSTGLLRMLFVAGGDADDMEQGDVQEVMRTGTVSEDVAEESRAASRFSEEGFLDFDGDFMAEITDEDSKVNVNAFSTLASTAVLADQPTYQALYGLMSGQENDQWFYDRNLERDEMIANLADWVDVDNTRSGNQSGYEDDLYNRLDSPYLSKNARFDTKEEIRLVDGWQDEVYERFGEQITVWGSGKINVNTASPEMLAGLLRAYMDPTPGDSQVQAVIAEIQAYQTMASFQNPKSFQTTVEGFGYRFKEGLTNVISTSSSVFRVVSSGVVGDTTVTITAVMDYSSSATGTVLYWRVD